MEKPKRKRRLLLKALIITIISFIALIIFISPITKYLVEKYDVKFTGREIKMDWAYVNPLTGYVNFHNVKIYEPKSDRVFLSANSISANFSLYKMLGGTYEITELSLDSPIGNIIQDKERKLNFQDIIDRFSSKKTKKKKDPTHFSILRITVNNGRFYYKETAIPVDYNLKKVNIDCRGIRWDSDTIAADYSFAAGIGKGSAKGKFGMNTKTLAYDIAIKVKKYELAFIEQYLKDMINYGQFRADFDANVKARGNFKNAEDIIAKGFLTINDFHFGKSDSEDFAAFKKLKFTVYELSPKYHKYRLDSVVLVEPYLKYERYDHLDNIQNMFGKKGSNVVAVSQSRYNLIIEIAKYVETLSKNFLRSNYKVNKLRIYKANFVYNDFALSEKFSVATRSLNIVADSISKTRNRVNLTLQSALKPYGNLSVHLSINPKDSSDFDLSFVMRKVSAAMFNPYLVSYTSFPLDRGTIEITAHWKVRNGIINSNNQLLVIDPRIGDRVRKTDAKWVPLPLVMFLVRETGNVINYQVPITGNLKSPDFHWRDVVLDVLKNIVVKPPTTVQREKVRKLEKEIEKSISITWGMNQYSLNKDQEKFLKKTQKFMKENPEAQLFVQPNNYDEKEIEHLLFFEAKKKYYLTIHKRDRIGRNDSIAIIRLSIKDSMFTDYLNKKANAPLSFTVQSKCNKLYGNEVQAKYEKLKKIRFAEFISHFEGDDVIKRIKVYGSKNVVPYNGFSIYSISYKGEIPEYLIKAHNKMNQINDEAPRKRFRRFRKQNDLDQ